MGFDGVHVWEEFVSRQRTGSKARLRHRALFSATLLYRERPRKSIQDAFLSWFGGQFHDEIGGLERRWDEGEVTNVPLFGEADPNTMYVLVDHALDQFSTQSPQRVAKPPVANSVCPAQNQYLAPDAQLTRSVLTCDPLPISDQKINHRSNIFNLRQPAINGTALEVSNRVLGLLSVEVQEL